MNTYNAQIKPRLFNHLTKLILPLSILSSAVPVYATYENHFVDDSSLTGNVFFWNRDRERKDIDTHKYEKNLRHTSFNTNLDFKSGYIADRLAIELGGYGAWEVSNGGNGHPNEIGFSRSHTRWSEDWKKDVSGLSFYKAQTNFKIDELFWVKAGYIQPSGQTLLAPHWSLLPGTYRGFEIGSTLDFDSAGALSMSYMWSDKYKAPWYKRLYEFKQWGKGKKIDYLHSAGLKYDFKNDLVLESAFGQAQNYMNQFFGKVSYKMEVFDNPMIMSYQFYGAKDQSHKGTDVYDGLAWLQAATLGYQVGAIGLRFEGVSVKADGEQGFFLQRMTPDYASSNGRLDIWWNSRSDFNANGEKAVFAEVTYDLSHLSHYLAGWKTGASYAYGWDAKPSTNRQYNQKQRLIESAYNFDLGYTVQESWAKDTTFQLHYTKYNNHSNIPSWGGGYGNIFQDERDIKFIVTIPFTVFSAKQK
ncbi:MAG: OprD family outer membrane porin [Gilliamella sp.]|uniref:OprD family outer membrane porin n=1 Tax=Gilliamella sp. TaxID=1891236 RepID=UPI0025FE77A2|nr:OprD family outer membrane porin [Gilliamella sp.]MCO6537188.1 OprD family outer membrane porin [Gilliamella sp.]